MTTATRVYCATCEETQLDSGMSRCAWCDGELTPLGPTRKYKRRKDSRWTDLKVNQCYEAYLKGHSCNQIAAVIWESMGFASQNGCSNALFREFKLAGFKLRSQRSVTASRNFKHGRATREGRVKSGSGAYRRWFKEQNGRYNPECKHDGCTRHAMDDDEFCYAHSPAREQQRNDHLAAMRAKRGPSTFVPGENHSNAKLTNADVLEIRASDKTQRELAERFGVTVSSISNIRRGKSWTHLEAA